VHPRVTATAGLAGVFTACLVGATLLLLTPVFEHMPLSALGAIVISGVIGLINCDEAVFLWRVRDVQAMDGLIVPLLGALAVCIDR